MKGFIIFGRHCPKVTVKIIGHVVTAEIFIPGDIIDDCNMRDGYGISFDSSRSLPYGGFERKLKYTT